MSLRGPTSSFSLRSDPVETPQLPPTKHEAHSGIRFNLDTIGEVSSPFSLPTTSSLVRFRMKQASPPDATKADVMRLTAVVDGLQSRYDKSTERATTAEAQLQRVSSALLAERSAAVAQAKKLGGEISCMKRSGAAMREQVANLQQQALKASERHESVAAQARAAEQKVVVAHKQLEDAKATCCSEREKNTALAEELVSLHAENKKAEKRVEELVGAHENALAQAAAAREQAVAASSARTEATEMLRQAEMRTATAETRAVEVEAALQTARGQRSTELALELQSARARAGAAEASASQFRKDLLAATSEIEEVRTKLEAARVELAAASAVAAAAPKRVGHVDAVQMHAEYNELRGEVLRIAAEIATAAEGDDTTTLQVARDQASAKAKEMKASYDTIFGAVDSCMERITDELARDIVAAGVLRPTPEPPPEVRATASVAAPRAPGSLPATTWPSNGPARVAAQGAIGIGISSPALLDCGCNVGATDHPPVTRSGVPIDESVHPQEYVSSVMEDLTGILKLYAFGNFV